MSTNTEDKWKFQDDIINVLIEMDKQEKFSTIVELPTGSGKTCVAISFIKEMAKENEDVKFLWLTDSIDLLLQSIISFMPEEDNIPEDYIIPEDYNLPEVGKFQLLCGSQTKRCKSIGISGIKSDTKILFASPRTLRKIRESESKEFRDWVKCNKLYIIYDEAHHIGADSAIDVFRSILLKNQTENNVSYNDCIKKYGLIGLTATVYRGDKVMDVFNHWFKDGYDGNKTTHDDSALEESTANELRNTIKITDIDTLIADGVLVAPTFERRETAKGNAEKENVLIDDIRANHKSWGKTVVFVNDIEMAHNVVEKLKKDKIKIFEYTSGTKDYKRLEEFKKPKSESDIMVTVDMVSEGFDVKDIETVYLFSGVVSPIRIRQRVGRVLRSVNKGTKKATVIWQDYGDGYLNPEIEYRKPIDPVFRTKPYFESEYHFFNMLEIFSAEELTGGIGYYTIGNELKDTIYVNNEEHEGYENLYHMIQLDSLYFKENKDLEGYADNLGLASTDELFAYIKENCFGAGSRLVRGRKAIIKQLKEEYKIHVNNEQIEKFFNYVVSNDLCKPEYTAIQVEETDTYGNGNSDRMVKIYAKYIEEKKIEKAKDYKDAIRLLSKVKRLISSYNSPKKYSTSIKIKAKGASYFHSELESCRKLMSLGCYYGKDEDFEFNNENYPRAYLGIGSNGNTTKPLLSSGKIVKRHNTGVCPSEYLVGRALSTVINHIIVEDKDVDDYMSSIQKIYKCNEKLAKELLFALGFNNNDDIIRAQCAKCKNDGEILPAMLQYVIYEKVYQELYKIVDYTDEEGFPFFECQNKSELEAKYKDIVEDYGLELSDMDLVNPVEDVIYDYRPYIKVIKNYQGIKPEFLTRLASEIFTLEKEQPKRVVDAFGGSGASTLNFLTKIPTKLHYNGYGYLNVNFYNVIKDENKRKKLFKLIDKVCKAIFAGDEETLENIIKKCYNKAEISNEILGKSYQEIFDEYCARQKDDSNGGEVKLNSIEIKYLRYLNTVTDIRDDCSFDCRKLEIILYGFVKKVQIIFDKVNEIKKIYCGLNYIEFALVFMIAKNFTDRRFFDDCTISEFAEFYATYETIINRVGDYISNIEITHEDAVKLMGQASMNDKDTWWYNDIPYSETDTKSYTGCIEENRFMTKIDILEGRYSISSRFNICISALLPALIEEYKKDKKSKGYLDLFKLINSQTDSNFVKRRNAIYEFYTRFTTREDSGTFDSMVLGDSAKRVYLSQEKKATYIFIPFQGNVDAWESGLTWDENDNKVIKKKMQINLNAVISREGMMRMLAGTLYSNIPVEIMVTNIDATNSKRVMWQDEEKNIGVMPTFTTGVNNYNVDAAVVVMKYDLYMEILRNLLFRKEFEEYEAKTYAASFREYYKQDR